MKKNLKQVELAGFIATRTLADWKKEIDRLTAKNGDGAVLSAYVAKSTDEVRFRVVTPL